MKTYPIKKFSIIAVVGLCMLVYLAVGVLTAPKADTTKPVTAISLTGTVGTNVWYKSQVRILVTATDKGDSGMSETRCILDPLVAPGSFSTLPSGCAYTGTGAYVTVDGAHTLYAASKDNAGNIESVTSKSFKMDATGPVDVALEVTAGTVGNNGWYRSDVTIRTIGNDSVSGIAICTADQSQNADTPGRIFTGSCTNGAGIKVYANPLMIKLDKTPPVVSVRVSPDRLWPPNHQLSEVKATVDVTDRTSGPEGFVLTSVTSSEPDEGVGDGDRAGDIQGFDVGTSDISGLLRAERAGKGAGRIYTLTYSANDMAGNSASRNVTVGVTHDPMGPRKPAIGLGANRVLELQRTAPGWEGTWYWYVDNTYNAMNLTGVTALGLLEAYQDTGDVSYIDGAKAAATFVMSHLGVGATGVPYWPRMTAPDIVMLHHLADVTGEPAYSERATLEWNNIKTYYPTAAALDAMFRSPTTNRRLGAWDLASFLEAAKFSGDSVWADDAAGILVKTEDIFYYGQDNPYYPLTVSGALRALAGNGYADTYQPEVTALLNMLVDTISDDNIDGGIQTTAYGIMALRTVGGPAHSYANAMAKWLAAEQVGFGGWLDGEFESPGSDGEAVRAIAATIGKNLTLPGFAPRQTSGPGWRAGATRGRADVFDVP